MGEMPVNNKILKWARESSNISIEDVAHKMDKTKEDIESWEKGEKSPTYIQLEKLAYNVYKRPIAIFFFPEPPPKKAPKNLLGHYPILKFKNYLQKFYVYSDKPRQCR